MSASDRRRLADQPLDFTITAEERLADGFRPLDRLFVSHASLDGTQRFEGVRREVLRAREAAIILPYDPNTDEIVIIRQFRIGAALKTPNAAALELPAGLLDGDEKPAVAAVRELREETGLEALATAPIFSVLTSPGLCDEVAHYFMCIVDTRGLPLVAGLADEHEDIIPIAAPAQALIAAMDEGFIANNLMVTALNWFDRKGRPVARMLSDSIETPA
ncbi:NUDIX domain-containing protein [Aureimonas altamirensis]|uniref:NUDIX domain-containing protein n=1 Tax=Aureimonas altamirensis TaxID=370622 RepID=UPI003019633B